MKVLAPVLRTVPLILWAVPGLVSACAHDPTAEPRSANAPEEDEDPEPVAVTVFTDTVELFMEYPRLVPGQEGRFLAHVTVLATGEPVRSGRLSLELRPADGPPITLEAARPTRDGLFIPVGALERPGRYPARIVVESDQVEATIPLEPIVVHADRAGAFAAAAAEQEAEPADAVPFLLEQQWQVGLLLEQVQTRSLARRLQVPGEVEAPQGAAAVVSAPLGGRLVPPDAGVLPRIGERVARGQVLAFVEPPLSTSDLAQLSANALGRETIDLELLLRQFDLETSALEVERSLLQSRASLEFARQGLARLETLRARELGTEAELEAARRDLEIARREHAAAQELAASYADARQRLADRWDGAAGSRPAAATHEPPRIPLVAPIDGEVVEALHVQGEHVDGDAAVFRLLDLERAWIVVHVSEFDLHALERVSGGLVELAGLPERPLDLIDDLEGRLVQVGRAVDPEARTVPLRYEVQNPEGLLRVGMFAAVHLETDATVDAVALPREAVVVSDGRPVAFVLLGGELFQKRFLELGIRDGPWVEVRSGVAAGERVATRGAYLVRLASASPASFGEGHAH